MNVAAENKDIENCNTEIENIAVEKIDEKIKKILTQMSLEEKIALCSGATFWETKAYEKYGIPALFMCDGPHGLRKQERENGADMLGVGGSRPATCFPAEVTTGASWDPALLTEIGSAIGEEALEQGVGLVLGPGANLKRNPLCGRNFEYFSEDPLLTGKLAAGFIRGVEQRGIGSSLKHFAANSQEKNRFCSDSIMDERTLRELYLTGFEIAVKEGKPSTVMCAYPKLNGVHCSDNKKLLTDILREEWGFEGMVVTDWGAMNDSIQGFQAGCDLNMPGGSDYMEKEVAQAVKDGSLSEKDIDASAGRVLRLALEKAGRMEGLETIRKTEETCEGKEKQTQKKSKTEEEQESLKCRMEETAAAHHALACKAAEEGAVLLKNEGSLLPIKEGSRLAVIGAMAKKMRFQGAGSSHIHPIKVSQPIDFLENTIYVEGCDDRGDTTQALLEEAIKAAKAAETAIVFAGLPDRYESEGFDRESMKMPQGHLRMIEAVAGANPRTVVVLLCGCVVECPWADKVQAILYMGLPGEAGGEAIVNLLYGRANPGGRLTESWPYHYEDVPSAGIYGKGKDALYQEGIYVGYRYYDKAGVKVRWPFGYGLSYTTFAYSDLQVVEDILEVAVCVKNTGNLPGAEVVQLYIAPPQGGLHRPVRELKAFQRVFLQPGEEKRVCFSLKKRDFAVWQDGFKVPEGTYTISVGSNLQQAGNICIDENANTGESKKEEKLPVPAWQKGSWYETCKGKPSLEEWERMLGRKYTEPVLQKGKFTMDNTVEEMKAYSLIMAIMYKAVEKTVAKGFGGKADYENPEFRMLMASSAGSPLRSMQISGGMKGSLMEGMLDMANGHFLRGIRKLFS